MAPRCQGRCEILHRHWQAAFKALPTNLGVGPGTNTAWCKGPAHYELLDRDTEEIDHLENEA